MRHRSIAPENPECEGATDAGSKRTTVRRHAGVAALGIAVACARKREPAGPGAQQWRKTALAADGRDHHGRAARRRRRRLLRLEGRASGLAAGHQRRQRGIEADEIDIATKYAGRVAELLADIGDMVAPGQVV